MLVVGEVLEAFLGPERTSRAHGPAFARDERPGKAKAEGVDSGDDGLVDWTAIPLRRAPKRAPYIFRYVAGESLATVGVEPDPLDIGGAGIRWHSPRDQHPVSIA
jgi:hypothetical protein